MATRVICFMLDFLLFDGACVVVFLLLLKTRLAYD